MLTADNAYIADILILTSFQFSDKSFNKEQPMLTNKILKIAQPCAAITLEVNNLHSFVLLSPWWWKYNVLDYAWDHRWWIITFLWVGWHIAALRWPLRILKIKTNFNKYFCYRILESGEGSAADTLQLSPTPPQTNLRGGVSHKGAWRIHPHLHQHRRHHHNTSRDYCTTFVVVKFSLLYEKFI